MKKITALLIAALLMFAFAACGDTADPSSVGSAAQSGASSAESAAGDKASSAPAEESKTTEESDPADESGDPVSSEDPVSGTGEQTVPDFIAAFISVGTVNTSVNASAANSIRLTGIDEDPEYGAVILYTYRYGRVNGLEDFAVAKFEYDRASFGYMLKGFSEPGTSESESIPDDGFLVAAHNSREDLVGKLRSVPVDKTVFPHGVQPDKDIGYTAKRSSGGINVDGSFSEAEWGAYKIDDINAENVHWSYAQFETGNYYSTASYYTAYDDSYLYLCVVVNSPYHYCPIKQSNAGDMWQYECIQVKVSSESPESDYIREHFDHAADNTAHNEGVVRSYGFAVNDDGETCYYENAITKDFTGLAACSRDDGAQLTVYEVAVPWAEFEITPASGMKLGLTFSVNSTNQEDKSKNVWKNITYRNGGGVIGRNDWSKIPEVTLG